MDREIFKGVVLTNLLVSFAETFGYAIVERSEDSIILRDQFGSKNSF
jgi:hypothetical protein